jgi:hypothetical protein
MSKLKKNHKIVEPHRPWRLYSESGIKHHKSINLCGCANNHTAINGGSSANAVLQRIILVQIESPGSMWFYKLYYNDD